MFRLSMALSAPFNIRLCSILSPPNMPPDPFDEIRNWKAFNQARRRRESVPARFIKLILKFLKIKISNAPAFPRLIEIHKSTGPEKEHLLARNEMNKMEVLF